MITRCRGGDCARCRVASRWRCEGGILAAVRSLWRGLLLDVVRLRIIGRFTGARRFLVRVRMTEHRIQNEIRNALAGKCMLFRVNVGTAWTGSRVDKLPGRRALIHDARPFSTGLPPGFSDTFGLVPVIITADMVGMTMGQFLAGEIKADGGRVSPKQAAFLEAISKQGGRAGVWRSVDDALRTVQGEQRFL